MFRESTYHVYHRVYHHYAVLRKEKRKEGRGEKRWGEERKGDKRKGKGRKERWAAEGLKFGPSSATS